VVSHSQSVYNDDIQNRHPLKINDEPYISHTEECSVQKECLNLSLTDQCLIYHNDQWFEFTTARDGIYYLNIRNQDCRDVRGIQAVIFDGKPCQPESYQLITCISNGHQDDVYTEIYLEANKTYLLLIDGYLHDYCYFDIDISTELPDFAIAPDKNTSNDTLFSHLPFIDFKWVMDTFEAQDMQEYQIWRRHKSEKKSSMIWSSPNLRNAFGDPFIEYVYRDTVPEDLEGEYYYRIAGMRQDSSRLLIQSALFIYEAKTRAYDPENDLIRFTLPKSKRNTLFKITLREADTDLLLEKKSIQYDKLFRDIKLDITAFRLKGILNYEVLLENVATGEKQIMHFDKPHRFIKPSGEPELF
jgi:hypothetical protein